MSDLLERPADLGGPEGRRASLRRRGKLRGTKVVPFAADVCKGLVPTVTTPDRSSRDTRARTGMGSVPSPHREGLLGEEDCAPPTSAVHASASSAEVPRLGMPARPGVMQPRWDLAFTAVPLASRCVDCETAWEAD